jgi:hypothetical protein
MHKARLTITVDQSVADAYRAHADTAGMSLSGYINEWLSSTVEPAGHVARTLQLARTKPAAAMAHAMLMAEQALQAADELPDLLKQLQGLVEPSTAAAPRREERRIVQAYADTNGVPPTPVSNTGVTSTKHGQILG